MNGYPSFYPRIALVAPSPGDKPLSESVMVYLNDTYIRHSASMSKYHGCKCTCHIWIARTSAIISLTAHYQMFLAFNDGRSALTAPSKYWQIMVNAHVFVFHKHKYSKTMVGFITYMIATNDEVIEWKHFRVIGPLCGEFTIHPSKKGQSFDVFFDLRLNKRLSKQSWDWWFETPSRHEPLFKPMLLYRQLAHWEQNSMKCDSKYNNFHTKTSILKSHLCNGGDCFAGAIC